MDAVNLNDDRSEAGKVAGSTPDAVHETVAHVAEAFWQHQAEWQPELHAQLGLQVEHLPATTYEQAASQASIARELVDRLPDAESEDLGGDDADTVGFLRFFADAYAGDSEHFWLRPAGTPYQTQFTFGSSKIIFAQQTFGEPGDVDRYLGLAADFGTRVNALGDNLREQLRRGIAIPRPALRSAIEAISGMRATMGGFLAVDDARTARLDSRARMALQERTGALVDERIVPAIDEILALLESPDYVEVAGEGLGMSRQPGGEEAYRYFVRRDTSMDTTPEALHRLGLEQCEELSDRMREVRSALGYDTSEADFRNVLRERASLYARTPQEVEDRYLGYVARIEPVIDDYFGVLPEAPYGVARLDEQLEAGMTFGYYQPPAPAEPIGRYHYNGSNLSERSLLTAAALIYHELLPGHHFHIARQLESSHLPPIRRYGAGMCGAYAEGWAEYASGLGWEMGLYDDPWDAYGRLAHERFTAARLVVDTALNLGWWTHDQAMTYMRANMTESETQLRSEVVRYSTDLPAQALGYRAGFLGISGMRAEAERRAGERFDIRRFHEAALGGGGLPLTVLGRRVSRETAGH